MKTDPQLEIIVRGAPWRVTMRSKYSLAYCVAVYLASTGRKWVVFVRRSTINQIESYPLAVQGKHIIKSMEISSHF
jgi:hypothetical protein